MEASLLQASHRALDLELLLRDSRLQQRRCRRNLQRSRSRRRRRILNSFSFLSDAIITQSRARRDRKAASRRKNPRRLKEF
jgi:hypothetical protein